MIMKYLIPSTLIAVTTGLIYHDILPVWAGIVWVASAYTIAAFVLVWVIYFATEYLGEL